MAKLTGQQIADEGLHGWIYLLGGLQTRIHTRDFATGLSLVNAIGTAAEPVAARARPRHPGPRVSPPVLGRGAGDGASGWARFGRRSSGPIRCPADHLVPDGSEEPRQRWHPDVWVDPAEVEPRIDVAIAAGGTLVSEAEAPRFWVLADPEGNRVCLCTWQERD